MKLYATIRNVQGVKVGKSDDTSLSITLNKGNKQMAWIKFERENFALYLTGKEEIINHGSMILIKFPKQTKGKKKKDEICPICWVRGDDHYPYCRYEQDKKGKKQKGKIDCGCEKDVFTCYKHRNK